MSTTSYQGIYACSTVLPVLCVVVVALRFYVRSKQKLTLQFDDWAQIPALFIFFAMSVVVIYGVKKGALGYPDPIIDPPGSAPTTILVEKIWFALQTMQIPALALIKTATLYFYRRIFCASTRGPLYFVIWALMISVVAWGIGFTVFYLTSCGTHESAAWSGLFGFIQYCRVTETFELSFGISDFLLDTFILTVPIPSIWKLQTSLGRKIGITGVFMFALIGYAASLARMITFIKLTITTLNPAPPDIQLQDTQATWFSMLELGFSIFAINLPSLWGLITSISVESVVRSIRSVISLHSLSSGHRSNPSRPYTEYVQDGPSIRDREPASSTRGFVKHSDDCEIEHAESGAEVRFGSEYQGKKTHREVLEKDQDQVDLENGIALQDRTTAPGHHI